MTPAGFAPLRRDAPGRREAGRGSVPDLASDEARLVAMEAYGRDVYAASSLHVRLAKLTTVGRLLKLWSLEPYPVTEAKVHALGASLKAGQYRTAESYLLLYRGEAGRLGQEIGVSVARAFGDARRSCTRGLGGPVRAMALPFSRLAELPGGFVPWIAGGPLGPRNAVVAGSWFLTREVELSAAPAATVEVHLGPPLSVTWALPASKTDVVARGTVRRHGCACGGGRPWPIARGTQSMTRSSC